MTSPRPKNSSSPALPLGDKVRSKHVPPMYSWGILRRAGERTLYAGWSSMHVRSHEDGAASPSVTRTKRRRAGGDGGDGWFSRGVGMALVFVPATSRYPFHKMGEDSRSLMGPSKGLPRWWRGADPRACIPTCTSE